MTEKQQKFRTEICAFYAFRNLSISHFLCCAKSSLEMPFLCHNHRILFSSIAIKHKITELQNVTFAMLIFSQFTIRKITFMMHWWALWVFIIRSPVSNQHTCWTEDVQHLIDSIIYILNMWISSQNEWKSFARANSFWSIALLFLYPWGWLWKSEWKIIASVIYTLDFDIF